MRQASLPLRDGPSDCAGALARRHGQVVATQVAPANGSRWEIEREIPVERSSWIAARVLGPQHRLVVNDAQVFAHSSPVYCYFGNQPISSPQDAAFFVRLYQPAHRKRRAARCLPVTQSA